MKNHIVLFCCLICCFKATAQSENNNWCFGHRTGLSFNSGGPVFFEHNMQVYEGCASVSDAGGNLLFYASGAKVWDRNGNLMPNGTALNGNNGSSANGVAIVPYPGNPGRYFVVTTDQIESTLYNAYYSVVDMSLNGGLGDVVAAQSSIQLATDIAEGVKIAPADDCGYWILLHRRSNDEYLAHKIGISGVDPVPVVSTGLPGYPVDPTYVNFGYMQFNHAYSRIMRLGGTVFETAAFNKATGVLSGFSFIDPAPYRGYFAEFSPNDSLLYFSGAQDICQMNMGLWPNVAAVQASIIELDTSNCAGMRMSPDNKIYIMKFARTHLARIDYPNVAGTGCGMNATALALPPYAYPNPGSLMATFAELGNPVLFNRPDTIKGPARDTMICFLDNIVLDPGASYDAYHWNTGAATPLLTVSQDGLYWRQGIRDCEVHTDTFRVHFNRFTADLGPDTTLCAGKTLLLDASLPGASYRWQDGSTGTDFGVSQPGIYSVAVSKEGCTAYDTVYIDYVTPQLDIPEPDTTLCKGTPLILHAYARPAGSFLWSNGSTEDHTQVNGAGKYTVTATSVCGILQDEVTITEIPCNCEQPFVPNAFTPNSDGKNEALEVRLNCPGVSAFYFAVYNRFGQRVFESRDPLTGWNGRQNGRQADVGTYFYWLQYKLDSGVEVKKKGDITLLH